MRRRGGRAVFCAAWPGLSPPARLYSRTVCRLPYAPGGELDRYRTRTYRRRPFIRLCQETEGGEKSEESGKSGKRAQGHADPVGQAADRRGARRDQGQEARQGEPVRARARRRECEVVCGCGATLRLQAGLPDDR